MNISTWIRFESLPVPAERKTGVWQVVTEDGGTILGRISWWAAWRKYAFFPHAHTLYEQRCLRDISQFLDEQMTARRKP